MYFLIVRQSSSRFAARSNFTLEVSEQGCIYCSCYLYQKAEVHIMRFLRCPVAPFVNLNWTLSLFRIDTMSPLQEWSIQQEYDPKNMPFRRLGPSGLRVPVFSLGGCTFFSVLLWSSTDRIKGLTLGGSLKGDPVKVWPSSRFTQFLLFESTFLRLGHHQDCLWCGN